MDLTLTEAATLLGQTERQVRYAIRQERLAARKVDGGWLIDSDSLPLNAAQRAALGERVERAEAV